MVRPVRELAPLVIASLAVATVLALVACQKPATRSQAEAGDASAKSAPEPGSAPKPEADGEPPNFDPADRVPRLEAARPELVATDLPPVPTLESRELEAGAEGSFPLPAQRDELAARAALELEGGLLLVGQAYRGRRPGAVPQSWRWLGLAPPAGEARSTVLESGAIRGAALDASGNGLLVGTSGVGFDARGWFGLADRSGTLELELTLQTPSQTELFTVLPGRAQGELAVAAGYVDAQGWAVSLDAGGAPRWEKYVGSVGYTQVRTMTALDADTLLWLGSRGAKTTDAWWARAPADGGSGPAGDDVEQGKVEVEGADPHQMFRAHVKLADGGVLAVATAKKNFIQAHDQLIAARLDPRGEVLWSKVVEGVRVVEVFGGQRAGSGGVFLVTVPLDDGRKPKRGLALVEISGDEGGAVDALAIAGSEGRSSAGFVIGSKAVDFVIFGQSDRGLDWRRVSLGAGVKTR